MEVTNPLEKRIAEEIDLVRERIKELESEEVLKGTIRYKYIKCGRKACHCHMEGFLHGPYPHLQWLENGKLKTKYINRKEIEKYSELDKKKRELMDKRKRLKILKGELKEVIKASENRK